jgi:hypothetical protein
LTGARDRAELLEQIQIVNGESLVPEYIRVRERLAQAYRTVGRTAEAEKSKLIFDRFSLSPPTIIP